MRLNLSHLDQWKITGGIHDDGGAADTPSLCGREVAWDINVSISVNQMVGVCEKCASAFKTAKGTP